MTVVSRESAGDFNARVEGQAMSRERSSTFFIYLVTNIFIEGFVTQSKTNR